MTDSPQPPAPATQDWGSFRQMPKDPPDWADKGSVAAWIGRVRSVAFFAGARHEEIDKAEAEQLLRHRLAHSSPEPSLDTKATARVLLDAEVDKQPSEIDLLADDAPPIVTEAAALRAIERALQSSPSGAMGAALVRLVGAMDRYDLHEGTTSGIQRDNLMEALEAARAALSSPPESQPELCGDCPPVGYPTDKTRCEPCPRRSSQPEEVRERIAPSGFIVDLGDGNRDIRHDEPSEAEQVSISAYGLSYEPLYRKSDVERILAQPEAAQPRGDVLAVVDRAIEEYQAHPATAIRIALDKVRDGILAIAPPQPSEAEFERECFEAAAQKIRDGRVHDEALEEAARVADSYAKFARQQAARQPAEWTTAAETAEIIRDNIRNLKSSGKGAGR